MAPSTFNKPIIQAESACDTKATSDPVSGLLESAKNVALAIDDLRFGSIDYRLPIKPLARWIRNLYAEY